MKKAALLLIVALFTITGISAQQRQRATPEERAKKQTESMVDLLSLTAEQKEKVYQINLKYANEAPKPGNKDESREKRREAMMKKMEARSADIKAVLTEEQQKKFDEHQKSMQDRMRENRRQRNN
ncbi:MAG: Spy/CpxP family protein refolding chaperone [Dysgonomonas sp.]|nr:Spy/CpxP family protein refolding chaperone [Dysgonomonas sp.]